MAASRLKGSLNAVTGSGCGASFVWPLDDALRALAERTEREIPVCQVAVAGLEHRRWRCAAVVSRDSDPQLAVAESNVNEVPRLGPACPLSRMTIADVDEFSNA
jgi:hypothetical protein